MLFEVVWVKEQESLQIGHVSVLLKQLIHQIGQSFWDRRDVRLGQFRLGLGKFQPHFLKREKRRVGVKG